MSGIEEGVERTEQHSLPAIKTVTQSREPTGGMPREAIIFVPGLNQAVPQQDLSTLCRLLRQVLFDAGVSGTLSQSATAHPLHYGLDDEYAAALCRITLQDGDQALAGLDVYKFDYGDNMPDVADMPLWRKVLVLPRISLAVSLKVALAFLPQRAGKYRKNANDILGLLWTLVLCLLFFLVALVIFLIVLYSVYKALYPKAQIVGLVDRLVTVATLVAVAFGLAKYKSGFLTGLDNVVAEYLFVVDYITSPPMREKVGRALHELIGSLNAREAYDRIHLASYSFGTIIALDAAFPDRLGVAWQPERIDGFVTIGCPIHIVRVLWPFYFSERQVRPGRPKDWLNIYHPADVLGSAIAIDDIGVPEGTAGVLASKCDYCYTGARGARHLRFRELAGNALKFHSQYWAPGAPGALHALLWWLCRGEGALATRLRTSSRLDIGLDDPPCRP